MKKFLFVANRFDRAPAGGTALCHAHYEALCSTLDGWKGQIVSTLSRTLKEKPEPDKISIKCARTRFEALINTFTGKAASFGAMYSLKAENEIVNMVKDGSYSFIWFDDCTYGSTVRKIKAVRPDLPVYVFYHVIVGNCLLKTVRNNNIFRLKGLINIQKYINYMNLQKLSAEYADVNVILNERDMTTFTGLYGSHVKLMLPVSFIDSADIMPAERKSDEFNIFFIGIRMKQNIDGIKWFALNVMPKLDSRAKLIIAGTRMDRIKDEPEFRDNPKINVAGRVESLDPYYNMADLVIVPIFYGEGMMTKAAEAMMYGKNILATSHALNGYPDIEAQSRCDTAEEFITRINAMIENGTERFNPEMRKIFEEKYSVNAMANVLREDLKQRGII